MVLKLKFSRRMGFFFSSFSFKLGLERDVKWQFYLTDVYEYNIDYFRNKYDGFGRYN